MAAYLNQNFYGNRSYGVQAAARTYFGKDLKDLTLAQMALLAAIPQSPTKFDLVKNAIEEQYTDAKGVPAPTSWCRSRATSWFAATTSSICLPTTRRAASCPAGSTPRRNTWPPRMSRSSSPPRPRRSGAPHFVWQVRDELGRILCGADSADNCQKIDTDGYTVVTTLDYQMQRTVEKWLFVAALGPNSKDPAAVYRSRKIPTRFYDQSADWLRHLRGRNIHNAAAAIVDYRTGEILAYVGSARTPRPAPTSSSPSSTCSRTAGGSPGRRSSHSTTWSASTMGR